MAAVRSVKRIGASGDSKIISITKEAKELNLSKGDEVSVIFEDPENPSANNYDFACMLANPDAAYVNSRCLVPGNTYLDGSPIVDLTEDVESTEREILSTWIESWYEASDKIREVTKDMVICDSLTYSDTMRSFISQVDLKPVVDVRTHSNNKLYVLLQLIQALADDPRVIHSDLDSVSTLIDHVDYALDDMRELKEGSDDRETKLKEINTKFDQYLHAKPYPDPYFVGVVIAMPMFDGYESAPGTVLFRLYQGPCADYAYDVMRNDPSLHLEGCRTHYGVYGPYKNEEDAQDMLSHFRMESKRIRDDIDTSFYEWCNNEVTKY